MDPWNWAVASALYSQLTGVLAGFAFTSIVLLISNTAKLLPNNEQNRIGRDKIGKAIYALMVVFVGLIMSSFQFAMLTGYPHNISTVHVLDINGTITSFIFATSIFQLFMSLALIFAAHGFSGDIIRMVRRVFRGVSLLAFLYLISTIAECNLMQDSEYMSPFFIVIPLITVFVGLYTPKLTQKVSSFCDDRFNTIISAVFFFFIILAGFFEYIEYFEPNVPLILFIISSFILLNLLSLLFLCFDFYLLGETEPPKSSS